MSLVYIRPPCPHCSTAGTATTWLDHDSLRCQQCKRVFRAGPQPSAEELRSAINLNNRRLAFYEHFRDSDVAAEQVEELRSEIARLEQQIQSIQHAATSYPTVAAECSANNRDLAAQLDQLNQQRLARKADIEVRRARSVAPAAKSKAKPTAVDEQFVSTCQQLFGWSREQALVKLSA